MRVVRWTEDLADNPMSTQSFVQAKKVGRWFEALARSTLAEVDFEVIGSKKLEYRDKRNWD
jgi:hypothetical protein